MTTYLGKSCSFGLPRVPLVNLRQFMYLVISLLVLQFKATTVNRLNYNRRKLRVMYKTDKPSYQMWHMDNPSCAEKTDKRSFLFGNHNY